MAKWLVHWSPFWELRLEPWPVLLGIFIAIVLLVHVHEMAIFQGAGRSLERMALTLFVIIYLGLLPCFFAQLRWLYDPGAWRGERIEIDPIPGNVALALAIFVPKCCDIGAYSTGRLIGRHQMTPVLSPKKTWEGAAGGLALSCVAAVGIDRFGPAPLLHGCWAYELGFGLTVGVAGMLGDLAESLIKRDCQQKDASQTVPGFGGVLDVVDSVIYSAPVTYLWLIWMR
jgi:phosphatidate cytidylyltransferase